MINGTGGDGGPGGAGEPLPPSSAHNTIRDRGQSSSLHAANLFCCYNASYQAVTTQQLNNITSGPLGTEAMRWKLFLFGSLRDTHTHSLQLHRDTMLGDF